MNNTKEQKTKSQIKISATILILSLLLELFIISLGFIHISVIALVVIGGGAAFVLANACMTWDELKEAKKQEYLENIYKSEKASYILLKKSFDEMEQKIDLLQESSKVSTDEIINAQKGVAKVIVNRNKENADAVIRSNDQTVLKDILAQIKETELNLNQAIQDTAKAIEKIEVSSYIAAPIENVNEEVSVVEEISVVEEPVMEEIPVEEELVEEVKPAMPDLSDPNKMMSPDDIAALLASMNGEDTVEETPVEEEPVEEVKPAMPDLSDPNKMMSPEDIAALLANL